MQTLSWPKMIHTTYFYNETVTFNMKIKPCILIDQSGPGACVWNIPRASLTVSLSCDITPGKNQSDCTKLSEVFKNVVYSRCMLRSLRNSGRSFGVNLWCIPLKCTNLNTCYNAATGSKVDSDQIVSSYLVVKFR